MIFRDASPDTWIVAGFEGAGAKRKARLVQRSTSDEPKMISAPVADLVVVAEFREAIYPGLNSTDIVENSAEKPYHAVINGENFHVLQALSFVCRIEAVTKNDKGDLNAAHKGKLVMLDLLNPNVRTSVRESESAAAAYRDWGQEYVTA